MLEGLRVVELASDRAAFAGKLLGDLGADVVVVEPPGGHRSRSFEPFLEGENGPDRSLWWWYYNTSKRSIVLDLDTPTGATALRSLIAASDIVLEAEDPDRLRQLNLDPRQLRVHQPGLIWVSVTPFGRRCSDLDAPMTDLTILARGGVVWSCGYDDHTLPPIRGGGGQAQHIAGVFAAMGTLVAVLSRDATRRGQDVDVSMVAAANVTTETGTIEWLVARGTVQRQTGRHAAKSPTLESQVLAADGRFVTTGFPPHTKKDFQVTLEWLTELELRTAFPETFFLEMGVERGGIDYRELGQDPEVTAIYGAGRAAVCFIASHLPAYDFFIGAQERDMQCGIVYAPEQTMEDVHFRARGFPVRVQHPEIGREFVYPGAPFLCSEGPAWGIHRRPPLVGEHTDEVLRDTP